MANRLYPLGANSILKAQVDFESGSFSAVLLPDSYAYSATHEFLSDLGPIVGSKSALTGTAVSVAELKARSASITVDGYRAGAAAAEAQAGSYMRRWEADIRQYQAGRELTFQVAKTNNDAIIHTNDARMEAAKVGLTTGAQQLASAWAMVGASASISGTDSTTRQL